MIEIKIPLPPAPWQSAKKSGNFFYDPKEAEKRVVKYLIASQYKNEMILEYTVLDILCCFKPPPSASKKKRVQMLAGEIIPTRSDCTNLQKLYEDCLKKIVIDDDRKVAQITSKKIYAEKDEVIIKIWTLNEYVHAHHPR